MTRNDVFSGLVRGAVHSSGELLYRCSSVQDEDRHVPQLRVPASEPARQVQASAPEIDIDVRHWLKVRDQALGY